MSPTSDGIYRVSYLFPFVRLINQNRKGISRLRRALFGNWRTGVAPAGQMIVNESIHESAVARFGKRAPLRRGDALGRRKYRPMNLAAVIRKRKPSGRVEGGCRRFSAIASYAIATDAVCSPH